MNAGAGRRARGERGCVGVKIEFAKGGSSLQETLAAFLIRQKSGL